MGTRFRELTRSDWRQGTIRLVLLVVGLVASAILLTYLWEFIGFLIWIVLSVLGIAWLIRWQTRTFGFQCPKCDYAFTISTWTHMTTLNLGDRKLLRCPNCGVSSACKVVARIEDA